MSKTYTPEYKAEAVKLAREVGNQQAALDLGVPAGTIGTWVHKAKIGEIDLGPGQQSPKGALTLAAELQAVREKNKQLEKEITRLKKENVFLEEASAFFVASRQRLAKTKGPKTVRLKVKFRFTAEC